MKKTLELNYILKLLLIDSLAVTMVYFVPAISHILPMPVYLLDPMRVVIFLTLLFSKDFKNTLLIAATVPLFSSLVSGHPIFAKSILISLELLTNILFIDYCFAKTKYNRILILFVSIVFSKIIYYTLKYAFINLGIITGELITTPLYIQLIPITLISAAFFILLKNTNINNNLWKP